MNLPQRTIVVVQGVSELMSHIVRRDDTSKNMKKKVILHKAVAEILD